MSTYTPNEEPYNDTGPRWTRTPPTEAGFYWISESGACTDIARLAQVKPGGPLVWRLGMALLRPGTEKFDETGVIFWSERIREPKT